MLLKCAQILQKPCMCTDLVVKTNYDTLQSTSVFLHQELLSLAKRKRSDSEEKEPPVSKPTASSDSETSDSDDEVSLSLSVRLLWVICLIVPQQWKCIYHTVYLASWLHKVRLVVNDGDWWRPVRAQRMFFVFLIHIFWILIVYKIVWL